MSKTPANMRLPGRLLRVVFTLVFSLLFISRSDAQTIRIMPLGNSITAGSMCTNGSIWTGCTPLGGNVAVGYRQRLYQLLSAAGYQIDFVGSQHFGYDLMQDPDCAGFGGHNDRQLAEIMLYGKTTYRGVTTTYTPGPYMQSYPADVVLLHIGTNDVLATDTQSQDVYRILDAIDDYEEWSGQPVMVFVARIIGQRGYPCGTHPGTQAYNALIEDLVAARLAAGDQISLVDMECGAGLDYNSDLTDEVHPNQTGYDKMADAWFTALSAWISPPQKLYELRLETDGTVGAEVQPDTPVMVSHGEATSIEVSQVPDGYMFVRWELVSGEGVSIADPEQASTTITLSDGDARVRAVFSTLKHQLAVTIDGGGQVVRTPEGSSFEHNSHVQLEAIADPGYVFTAWSGSIGGSENPVDLLMDEDKAVTARFSPLKYALELRTDGTPGAVVHPEGTIWVDHGANQAIEVVEVPEGYLFSHWEISQGRGVGILDDEALSTSVVLESGAATIEAHFGRDIVVSSVQIPDTVARVGDVVEVLIELTADRGPDLSVLSGKVGGYELYGLERTGTATYLSRLDIEEGGNEYLASEDIPVENLVLSGAQGKGIRYRGTIVQPNDLFDGRSPVITGVTVPDSVFAAGDSIWLGLKADQEGYRLAEDSHVNGITPATGRILLEDLSGGDYRLIYLVSEGDASVEPGALEAAIVLEDAALNRNVRLPELPVNSLSIVLSSLPERSMVSGRVYPNPASETLIFEPHKELGSGLVQITDLRGCRVYLESFPQLPVTGLRIDVSGLPPGVYILQLNYEAGPFGVYLWMKK